MTHDRRFLTRRTVLLLVMLPAVSLQLWTAARSYPASVLSSHDFSRSGPAWDRAARLMYGEDFARFIRFIREQVPEDGRLILPPRIPETGLSNIGLMQYFLFPREIHNCGVGEVEACVARVEGPRTYILALPDFPPRQLAAQKRVFLPFDEDRGLFAPP